MKKIRFINKYRNISSNIDDDKLNSEVDDSNDAISNNIGIGVKNSIKLNQTLELSKREFRIGDSFKLTPSKRNSKQTISQR